MPFPSCNRYTKRKSDPTQALWTNIPQFFYLQVTCHFNPQMTNNDSILKLFFSYLSPREAGFLYSLTKYIQIKKKKKKNINSHEVVMV